MLLPFYLSALVLAETTSAAGTCSPKSFEATPPEVFGIQVLDIVAKGVEGLNFNPYSSSLPPLPVEARPIDFCNVTVFYTHPGLNDTIRTSVWLPATDEWNGRFLGSGGGGYIAGDDAALAPGVAMGFAVANTDSGHSNLLGPATAGLGSKGWSLTSPGNVNLHLLQNFGYRSLDEMSSIGKHIAQTFYGKDITYSYWNGCSTGGRQGLTLAQRYPSQYQGILAAAPAINWVTFLITEYYAHVKMAQLNYHPPRCELGAITESAIQACDELDGVKDGVIGAAGLCDFDPHSVVGWLYDCEGDFRKITKEAAEIASITWSGPIKQGNPVWFGLDHEAALAGVASGLPGLANTICDEDNKNCKSDPFPISADWIKQFILKDPNFDLKTIDDELFHHILRTSRQEYYSIMDSADPDLTQFQAVGGKIISWHGLADQLIPPNGTSNYYERVEAIIPDVRNFFRHYEAPGVQHCLGGAGAFPATAIHQLMDWVENGQVPEYLEAATVPMMVGDPDGTPSGRKLCAWPQVAVFTGGDNTKAESFECRDGFDAVQKVEHDEL